MKQVEINIAASIRRHIICDTLHRFNDFDAYKILERIFRISKSTIRTIHKEHCEIQIDENS